MVQDERTLEARRVASPQGELRGFEQQGVGAQHLGADEHDGGAEH